MSFGLARVAPEKAVLRPALPASFTPGLIGTDMTKLSYREQLEHPKWQQKRLEALSHYGFACTDCGNNERMLHVHHRRYVKGRMAWEYSVDELNVLCKDCHAKEHEMQDLMAAVIQAGEEEGYGPEFVAGLLGGYLSCAEAIDEELEGRVAQATGPYFIAGQVAEMFDGISFGRLGKLARANVRVRNKAQEDAIKFLEQFNEPPKGQTEL